MAFSVIIQQRLILIRRLTFGFSRKNLSIVLVKKTVIEGAAKSKKSYCKQRNFGQTRKPVCQVFHRVTKFEAKNSEKIGRYLDRTF